MSLISKIRNLRQHFWLALAISMGLFSFAFALRFAFGDALGYVPFVTLFPAILVAALIGGLWIGVAVTLLSGVAALFFFVPPYLSFALVWPEGVVTMIFFFLTSAIQLYVIDILNRSMDEVAAERDRSAIMFQELQHRVANNMQFVASLLRLQERAIETDPRSGAQLLAEIRKRFETMARVHRRLYDPAGVRIPLTQYFQELCTDVLDASGAKNVVCVVNATHADLDAQRMLTLSLLVTEAITNSVKHAFKGEEQATLTIQFDHADAGYVVTVQDNGPGLPEGFAIEKSPSLGFKIMRSLATQLGGQITFGGPGMSTRLVFPH
jgi:two-component sensor histidine kinase